MSDDEPRVTAKRRVAARWMPVERLVAAFFLRVVASRGAHMERPVTPVSVGMRRKLVSSIRGGSRYATVLYPSKTRMVGQEFGTRVCAPGSDVAIRQIQASATRVESCLPCGLSARLDNARAAYHERVSRDEQWPPRVWQREDDSF